MLLNLLSVWLPITSALAETTPASLQAFQTTLSNLGYGRFVEALQTVSSSSAGGAILNPLLSGQQFTVYASVNEVSPPML